MQLNNGTEDCLKLNILRPARTEADCDAPMPVLVWLYGGGFKTGAADQLNASTLVMHSVQRVRFGAPRTIGCSA